MAKGGKLTVVPTPVGNLDDITLRALEVLRSADVVLAEDTRTSGLLLHHFDIKRPMWSHHKFNEHRTLDAVIGRLREGQQIALVSDAGTPGISDPGYLLVRECIKAQIAVECLPGATAFVPALVASGLPCDRFCFEGFLPQRKGRQNRILALADEERTLILYESPHRVVKLLEQLKEAMGGQRQAAVCRELTKMYEDIQRGTLDELLTHFTTTPPKGEFVIILGGKEKECKNSKLAEK